MKIPFENIQEKLGEWAKYFIPFWEKGGFDRIYDKLKQDSAKRKKILPKSENTFRMFKEVSPDNVKVIQIFQDPYSSVIGNTVISNGIALDCSNTNKLQPSLNLWYSGLKDCYFPEEDVKFDKNPSLEHYYRQGVLFLNSSYTVELNKPGSHKDLWKEFNEHLIEIFNLNFNGIPVILYGKEAQKLERYFVPFNFHIFSVEHMAAAAHQNREWKHENVFKKIDIILNDNNKEKINWFKDLKTIQYPI